MKIALLRSEAVFNLVCVMYLSSNRDKRNDAAFFGQKEHCEKLQKTESWLTFSSRKFPLVPVHHAIGTKREQRRWVLNLYCIVGCGFLIFFLEKLKKNHYNVGRHFSFFSLTRSAKTTATRLECQPTIASPPPSPKLHKSGDPSDGISLSTCSLKRQVSAVV